MTSGSNLKKNSLQPSIRSIGLLDKERIEQRYETKTKVFPSFSHKPNAFHALELIAEVTGSTVSMGYLGGVVHYTKPVSRKIAMLSLSERGFTVKQRGRFWLINGSYPVLFVEKEGKEDFIVASLWWHKENKFRMRMNPHYSVVNMALYDSTTRIPVHSVNHFIELTGLSTINVPIYLDLSNPHLQRAPFFEFYTTQLLNDFWIT